MQSVLEPFPLEVKRRCVNLTRQIQLGARLKWTENTTTLTHALMACKIDTNFIANLYHEIDERTKGN
jgi:hypothetical protein